MRNTTERKGVNIAVCMRAPSTYVPLPLFRVVVAIVKSDEINKDFT